MKRRHRFAVAIGLVGISAMGATWPAPFLKEIFSIDQAGNSIYRVDLSGGTTTNLGNGGAGFITNLAMSPDRTLYYMNPFEGGHLLYKATLNATNTALVGAPTLVENLSASGKTTGLGIIDGFTIGPDSNLYMTGYGKSEIYKYDLGTGSFGVTVRLTAPVTGGPAGEFRSDLAFDPVSNNLVGLGIEPGSNDRTLFEIPLAIVLSDATDSYLWDYYGGAGSAWSTKVLNIGTELGGNPDGIAFDPINGDLYMSGDGTGIYQYDRATAARGALVPGTGDGFLNGLGYDLAFQTRQEIIDAPLPGTLLLLGIGALGMWGSKRRGH